MRAQQKIFNNLGFVKKINNIILLNFPCGFVLSCNLFKYIIIHFFLIYILEKIMVSYHICFHGMHITRNYVLCEFNSIFLFEMVACIKTLIQLSCNENGFWSFIPLTINFGHYMCLQYFFFQKLNIKVSDNIYKIHVFTAWRDFSMA